MLKKYLRLSGIDKAIAYVLMAKGWSILSGVLILLLISKFLTSEEQGYYFTFVSVLGLQILFELGFGTVVIQFISHEMPFLHCDRTRRGGGISGVEYNLSRFRSIVKLIVKWYLFVGIALLLVVLPFGFYFFANKIEVTSWHGFYTSNAIWVGPWLTLILSAVLSLLVTPIISIAEGCGLVSEVSRVRLIQSVITSIIAIVLISSGFGLYSVAAPLLSLFLVGSVWIYRCFINIITESLVNYGGKESISWRKEIFPVQWRIAISWLSGYFIFQLFTPVAFKVYGAEFAGELGMSINITNLLLNLSLSWIMTKMPKFGNLIAQSDYQVLNSIFISTFKQSAFFLILLILSSTAFFFVSSWLDAFYMSRILAPELYFIMCLTTVGSHIVACQATYIRAHKVELYVLHSVITALLIVLMLSQASRFGSVWIIGIYMMIVWGFSVPYSTLIYAKFKRGIINNV
jgi:hypothetical protein